MENFKDIAEQCLAGELSGTFVLRCNKTLPSKCLIKMKGCICPYYIDGYYYSDNGNCYNRHLRKQNNDVIDFIPDNMQKKIEIDIPEGKVPVMEQTENGIVITWKEKELTYDEIESKLHCRIPSCGFLPNTTSIPFYKKVEVLRKLVNIRNYFGKPTNNSGYIICQEVKDNKLQSYIIQSSFTVPKHVVFEKEEHAEQAIKILGDELKYLFEPW